MWSCEFLGLTKSGLNLVVQVRYTNGTDTIAESIPGNDLSVAKLKQLCAARVRLLEQRDRAEATFSSLQPGPLDLHG